MSDNAERADREKVLLGFGAPGSVVAELLAYNANPYRQRIARPREPLPLADEPHLEAWRGYAERSREVGVVAALSDRLVQLRFPVREGMSASSEYLDATRRGRWPPSQPGLELLRPDDLTLEIHSTRAGAVPVLTAGERRDFVALVQAFSARNEPRPVPAAMGASIISGLNNWDRVRTLERRWRAEPHRPGRASTWAEEFRRVVPQKELYQDRFILLSRGPYSAVAATDAGLPHEEWLERSLVIRREHEATHYLTLRVLGMMRNNLLDELIADYAGLVAAFGRYRRRLALACLGLEEYPRFRASGRLTNYRGEPPLSDEAFEVVRKMAFEAVQNLSRFDRAAAPETRSAGGVAAVVLALAGRTLEELAAEGAPATLLDDVGRAVHRLGAA